MLWRDGEPASGDAAAPVEALAAGLEDAVFTTARVEGGRVVGAAAHRQRLLEDCAKAGLDRQAAEGALDRAAAELARSGTVGMLRVVVGRAGGSTHHVIALAPARRPVWRWGDAPLRLVTCADPRPEEAARAKAVSHRPSLGAVDDHARARGADAALLLDPGSGGIREGSFFHLVGFDGGWWRPGGEGILAGTTLARLGLDLEPREVAVDALARGPLFATSALMEVAAVGELDGRALELSQAAWTVLRAALDAGTAD